MRPPPSAPEGAPRVVCLDIGEVLIDETRVWTVWADLLGVSPFALMGAIGTAIAAGADHGTAFDRIAARRPDVLERLRADWEELEVEHERRYGGFGARDLYDDALPAIERLRAAGLEVAVAGNQPARRHEQLRALGVTVEVLVTSDEIGAAKPDGAFFAGVLARLDREPAEVLYVGDRLDNDVAAAAAVGLGTCWLRRGPWALLAPRPAGADPDLVVDDLGELTTALGAHVGATTSREGSRG